MKNQVIDDLVFEMTLIDPIKDIIVKLKSNDFRDCDIKWLNDKLSKFTNFALQTMGKKFELPEIGVDGIMNTHNKERFIEYFEILLAYFESFDID